MNGVTTYDVGAPPEAGAFQLTAAVVFPAVATTFVGTPGAGAAAVVIAFDGDEGLLLPLEFAAVTVNVYDVLLASPEIVVEVAGGAPVIVVLACAAPPVNGVTVYEAVSYTH